MDDSIDINLITHDIEKLPPTPKVLLKLIEQCHQVDTSFDQLAETILMDAALTTKIITAASALSQPNEITQLSQLLAELGLSTIRTIAITSAVHLFFSPQEPKSNHLLAQCWKNALFTAHISRALTRQIGYSSEDEAHCAGLLHQLGRLALLQKSPHDYVELQAGSNEALAKEEQKRFGHSYHQVGAHIVDHWQLNSFLKDALQYQLEPAKAILDAPHLVKLVNFASKLSTSRQSNETLLDTGEKLFGLNQTQLDEVMSEASSCVEQTYDGLDLKLSKVSSDNDIEGQLYNQETSLELARQVRNIAFLDSVRQHLSTASDLNSTLRIIQQDLHILFGLSHSLCFLYDAELNQLSSQKSISCTLKEGEFQIPVIKERSLVATAILQQHPTFSSASVSDTSLTVIDRQIIQLLNGEEIISIPLQSEQQTIGVLVAGFQQNHYTELNSQLTLLNYFSREAAEAVEQQQQRFDQQQQCLEIEHARLQTHTEKLLHEASNPLGIINNYLHLLAANLGEDHTAQSQLDILKEEMERVTHILWRIKEPPQVDISPQGEVNLNELILDLLSLFRASLFTTHAIKEVVKLDDTIAPVLGNRNNLKQVITNLVKNAIEAMPEGGSLELSTRGRVNVGGQLYVELAIADSGLGMSNSTIGNLFNPIVTQKGSGHSGVGLTIVKKLISDMGGIISCRSSADEGTEFQILLPTNSIK